MTFLWNNKEVKTFGDVFEAAVEAARVGGMTPVFFLTEYVTSIASSETPVDDPTAVALSNISYMAGYAAGTDIPDLLYKTYGSASDLRDIRGH